MEEKSHGMKRRVAATADSSGGDHIECSGKHCGSCTGGLIADCVAICCCPCVVLHCFALAFVKAPLVVGRRCLGLGNKNKKICKKGHEDIIVERNMETVSSSVGEMESVTINAGIEAEKVWKELQQIGHLDFGRVHEN
ncbi:uncharacterized protein LOC113867579 [Abrus precatorius]|uniref:Uncharacterized protein LOC113867579 n=1 Tax=Abrus precatorius TaxID=3816 RepID=A0A8B8LV53_ABRPR|nr:uncharacterized protein LOC113867579 [Abrus precatorius]